MSSAVSIFPNQFEPTPKFLAIKLPCNNAVGSIPKLLATLANLSPLRAAHCNVSFV